MITQKSFFYSDSLNIAPKCCCAVVNNTNVINSMISVNSGLKMLFYGGLKMSFFSGLRLSYI